MRFFVLDDEVQAQALVDTIDNRARVVFAAQGYTVEADGSVVGKAGGVDDPTGRTVTWDVPRQRLDGRWVVAHPEAHPSAGFQVSPSATLVQYLVGDATADVEEESADWWPSPVDA